MDTSGILDNNFVEVELYRLILESFEDGVYIVDSNRRIIYWSDGAERITGYLAQDVLGRACNFSLLAHSGERGTSYCNDECPLTETMKDGKARRFRSFIRHMEGYRLPVNSRTVPVKNRAGQLIGVAEIFQLNAHHYGLAQRFRGLEPFGCLDPDTGVANKEMTLLRLAHRLEDLRTFGIPVGVLGIRIEEQSPIMARFGGEAWLGLMRAAAQTLAQNLPPNGFVGRWDNERFVALLGNCDLIMLQETASLAGNLVGVSEISWWGTSLKPHASVRTTMGEPDDTPRKLISRLGIGE
jgi:PAS domain S-box-containing protein